jgi:hypothetical protein
MAPGARPGDAARLGGRDAHERDAEPDRETLGGRDPDPQASERAGARAHDDRPEGTNGDAMQREDRIDAGEQFLAVAVAREPRVGVEERAVAGSQGDERLGGRCRWRGSPVGRLTERLGATSNGASSRTGSVADGVTSM